jgi:biopolymer transport protein ExbD
MTEDIRAGERIEGFSPEEEEKILSRRHDRHKKARVWQDKSTLTLTSIMDMTTIILCFFLANSKSQAIEAEMSDELHMVWSSASLPIADMMTITITKQAVLVNDEFVVAITDGQIPESSRVSATSPIIPDLQVRVEDVLHIEERWDQVQGEVSERACTVIADHTTPYEVLAYVMMTASAAGVQNFKFAILHLQDNPYLWTSDL